MNYYPHHIGDFNLATRHLTLIQRALYRDLIDYYYDTEKPIPADKIDKIAARLMVRTLEERKQFNEVLKDFFIFENGEYRHDRCDEEIETYRDRQQKASISGKKSASLRAQRKANQGSTIAKPPLQGTSTRSQLTKNQEPRTNTPIPPEGDGEEGGWIGKEHKDFTDWFSLYPKQIGEIEAQREWMACSSQRPPTGEMIAILRQHIASKEWQDEAGKFIPRAAAYLNGQRWRDKLTPGKKVKPPAPERPKVDERDAFRWRCETYPMSRDIHPTPESFPFKYWPSDTQAEYLEATSNPTDK